jgi:hypothetical protein
MTGLAVTSLTSNHAEGASLSGFTTASVTPTANSELLLWTASYNGAGAQAQVVQSVSGLSLSWAQKKLWFCGSANKGDFELWAAKCGNSPGSGAITVTFTQTISGGALWAVSQGAGVDQATPTVDSNIVHTNGSSSAPSGTFGAAAKAQNLFVVAYAGLIGSGGSQVITPSQSPAWTTLAASFQSSTVGLNGVCLCTQVSPDVTHLVASAGLTASGSWGVLGIELSAAAAVASTQLLMASVI